MVIPWSVQDNIPAMNPKASSTHYNMISAHILYSLRCIQPTFPPNLINPPLTGIKIVISAIQLFTKLRKHA